MSICCDVNRLRVVEHERILRGTQGVVECFSDFSSALLSVQAENLSSLI
jgi:hypothetical protein